MLLCLKPGLCTARCGRRLWDCCSTAPRVLWRTCTTVRTKSCVVCSPHSLPTSHHHGTAAAADAAAAAATTTMLVAMMCLQEGCIRQQHGGSRASGKAQHRLRKRVTRPCRITSRMQRRSDESAKLGFVRGTSLNSQAHAAMAVPPEVSRHELRSFCSGLQTTPLPGPSSTRACRVS